MATINLGRIKLVNKGVWSNSTAYAIDDFVQYTDSGVVSTYIAVAASTNQTPSTSGTENSNFWKFLAKGVTDPISGLGNNKIVTTNSSGNAAAVSIGSAGEALKVNSSANGFEFGAAGKNIVMKTTQNEQSVTADASIIEVDIVASAANPTFNIAGIVSLNTRVAGNLDDENIQIDVDYSLNGGSSYTTLANASYATDVFSPGQDDTHNNLYDVNTRTMGTRGQVTMSAGATVRFRLHLDYGTINNGRTIYFNRAGSTSGQGASSIIVYEE